MFLTDLDSRASVKGSRDPLGLVPLWSHFGRFVVGNLTTVTTYVRGFTTLLLGYHFAREVQDRVGRDAESTLALFLKFEQLAAHCRYFVNSDGEFRGVERVKKTLGETSSIHLSVEPRDQILSNAKVYGLWGLYSSPARASGLLERDEPVLTPVAREFVEKQYLAFLTKEGFKEGRELVDLLRQRRAEVRLDGGHGRLARALARLLSSRYSSLERSFYRTHLVLGGPDDPTSGRQAQLAGLLGSLPAGRFVRAELWELIRQCRASGSTSGLLDRLGRIDCLESVLVPAGLLFGFACDRQGQALTKVADEVGKAWKKGLKFVDVEAVRALSPDIASGLHDAEVANRWVRLAEALSSGDYSTALRLLLEHNAFVMRSRNGSDPWIRVVAGRLDVRFRDAAGSLWPVRELADAWVNTYFLNSLKDVVHTLAEA